MQDMETYYKIPIENQQRLINMYLTWKSNKYWILSLQSKILQDTTWTDDHEKKSTMEIIN